MNTSLRIPAMMLWLTILWVALWGSVTWANVIGGVAVASGVVLFSRLDAASLRPTHFRPQWAIWYVMVLGWKLLESNLRLAYEILTPGNGTHTAILAIPMRGGSDAVVNLVANSITLTPGTMTIDVKQHDHDHLDPEVVEQPPTDQSGSDDEADLDTGEPGLADAVPASVTLYVHGMYARDVEAVRHEVLQLEALALRAFGNQLDYERSRKTVIDHATVMRSTAPLNPSDARSVAAQTAAEQRSES